MIRHELQVRKICAIGFELGIHVCDRRSSPRIRQVGLQLGRCDAHGGERKLLQGVTLSAFFGLAMVVLPLLKLFTFELVMRTLKSLRILLLFLSLQLRLECVLLNR